MGHGKIDQAAATLLACWRDGSVIASLPDGLRPASRAEGYAIQARYAELAQDRQIGWKIAATSPAGQQHIGVEEPLAGCLLAGRVYEDGATVPLGPNRMLVAEAEFAFRLGADLPVRADPWEPDEVLAAVDSLHPAIELPDSRFEPFEQAGGPQLIADNACARQFVLGAAMPGTWREGDLAQHPVLISGAAGSRCGAGANVLGSPVLALAWIATELSRHGTGLAAGEVITTGTCTVPLAVSHGDRVTADFGSLGRVSVGFEPARPDQR